MCTINGLNMRKQGYFNLHCKAFQHTDEMEDNSDHARRGLIVPSIAPQLKVQDKSGKTNLEAHMPVFRELVSN